MCLKYFVRLQSNACQEKKEGTTYLSEVDLYATGSKDLKIPPCQSQTKEPVEYNPESHVPVFFDLETTGLGNLRFFIHFLLQIVRDFNTV